MPINQAEIAERHDRLRSRMDAAGLDAVLVGERYNYWYLTGHRTREIEKVLRPMLFLLPRAGDPVAVVYRQQGGKVKANVPSVRLHDYEDLPFDPALLVDAFRDSGLERCRVGLELGPNQRLGIAYAHLQELLAALPDLVIADAGPCLEQLRMHKSAAELAVLREVAEMSLRAWARVVADFRPGRTERDFATAMGMALVEEGSDFDVAGHVTIANSRQSPTAPLTTGDTIWCDFGATLDGYQADVGRRAVIGTPTEDHLAVHERVATLFCRSLDAVRPGARASDVAAACDRAMRDAGLPGLTGRKRIGHGLGLNAGEGPSLGLEDHTVLEPGMVLCVEPRFFLDTGEKVHIEDVVVVTDDGYERISSGAETLAVIADAG
jgi:Xaa-Pro aminopeptidase